MKKLICVFVFSCILATTASATILPHTLFNLNNTTPSSNTLKQTLNSLGYKVDLPQIVTAVPKVGTKKTSRSKITPASLQSLRSPARGTPISATTNGLVAYYAFDNNVNDSIGSNTGAAVNSPTYSTGRIGTGINLASGSFVRTTTTSGITSYPFSFSVWVKPSTSVLTFQAVAGLYNSSEVKGVGIGSSGKATIFVTNSFGQEGTTNIRDGSWHHLTGVFTSTTAKLYVDGNLEVDTGWEPDLSTAPMRFAVGGWDRYGGNTVDYAFTGMIDDLRIYSRVLTPAEVSEIYTDVGVVVPDVINGSCGPAAKTYTAFETFPSGAYCTSGTLASTPASPTQGGSVSWSCAGSNGGTTAACSASRAVVSSDSQAPTTPGIPTSSSITSTGVTISWTASTDNTAVTGYTLERCTGVGCSSFAPVTTQATLSYTDSGLTANTTYLYRVKAVDAAGNVSPYSGSLSVITTATTPNIFTLTVSKTGAGTGTVTGGTISCGSTCTQATIAANTAVTLTATPASGSTFTGWSGGGCSGTGTCVVTVTGNTTVTATFAAQVVSNELLITNITPKGKISNSASQVTLSLNTNWSATCKYSRTAGSVFNEADVDFTSTGGTSHSVVISNLAPGKSYHYFARCTGGGKTSLDMPIYFHTGDWVAPVGIPDPKNFFGGYGVDRPTPSWPASWTAATPSATPNYFYVDNTAPNATDSGNTYGHPGLPRKTPPAFWTHTLTPGAFIYINAGVYTINDASIDIRDTHGTAENPIWFSGNPNNHPIFESMISMGTYGGASYIVFENIDLRSGIDSGGTRRWAGVDVRPTTPGTSVHHILIRNSTMTGTAEYYSFGGIGIGGSELSLANGAFNVSDIAVFNVNINTNGLPTGENSEQTGVYKAHKSGRSWVLDSTIHAVGADGVAGAHGGNTTDSVSEHYYIGRNVLYESGENCIDLKSTRYVVISENECWGPFGREQGWGIVIHSGSNPVPVRDVWLINNRVHHASAGIIGASTNGTQDVSVIGNIIYDIKAEYAFHGPNDGPDPQYGGFGIGILAAGGNRNYILNNTIYNSDRGIGVGPGAQVARVSGNIINSPTTPPLPGNANYFSYYRYYDMLFESIVDGQQVFGVTNDYNFYPSTTRIERGNSIFNSVDQFRSATNEEDHGLSGNPLFVNPANADFRLQSGSPAINTSSNFLTDANLQLTARRNAATDQSTVAFYNELITDLTQNPVDFLGNPRPQSGAWDIGAYEYTGPLTPSAPVIVSHPQSQTKAVGQTATFSVSATGYPTPTYQWQKNGVNISGATNSSYTTPTLQLSDSGTVYRVIVQNNQGSPVTSNTATLTVTSAPITPTNHAPIAVIDTQDVVISRLRMNLSASLSFDQDGDVLSYQWSKVEGPGTITFAPPTGDVVNAVFSAAGIYTIKLIATDPGGLTSEDYLSILVGEPETGDADSDGVPSPADICPNTPPQQRANVNRFGCPRPRVAGFDIAPDVEQDLRTVANLRFGRLNVGEVRFDEQVNLVRENDVIDVTAGLVFTANKVALNSTLIPELNKRATITLYGITETTPKILKDGVECVAPTCVVTSFANNTLVFQVLGFSTYEVVAGTVPPVVVLPVTPPTGGGSNGGGNSGGGGTPPPTVYGAGLPVPKLSSSTAPKTTATTYIFNRDLKLNMKGADVKKLKLYLKSQGYTIDTATDLFTAQLRTALIKYQKANKLTQTGTLNRATRDKINGKKATNTTTKPTVTNTTRVITLKSVGPDVLAVQKFLNRKGFTIAKRGLGSKGKETTKYGLSTRNAVIRFQKYYKLPVTGNVDAKTREVMVRMGL